MSQLNKGRQIKFKEYLYYNIYLLVDEFSYECGLSLI
jgi:hypothetical protein